MGRLPREQRRKAVADDDAKAGVADAGERNEIEPQRIAITLMDLAGFTAREVAELTDAPRGTVLARVHRGRKALALQLRDHAPDSPLPSRVEEVDRAQ